MNLARETLGNRRAGFSPACSLLMSAYSLPVAPGVLAGHPSQLLERSPTTDETSVRSFGVWLEPRYIFGADSLDQ